MKAKYIVVAAVIFNLFDCIAQEDIYRISSCLDSVMNKTSNILVKKDEAKHILTGLSITSYTNLNNKCVNTDITYAGAGSNRLLLIRIDLVVPQNNADIFKNHKMLIPLYRCDSGSLVKSNMNTNLDFILPLLLYHESYLRLTCFENAESILKNSRINYYLNIASNSCTLANSNAFRMDIDIL